MRRRSLPPAEDLLSQLEENGVTDAPREGADEEALKGLLDTALWIAEHRKQVVFGDFFSWAAPGFAVQDSKVKLRVEYAPVREGSVRAVDAAIDANLERSRDGLRLLALDLHDTGLTEFAVGHHLYGEVTLFSWPHKPPQSADPRIEEARERGWVKVLKEHNLMPGRGIVVLDEHQGRLLTDPRLADLLGFVVLLNDGQHRLWWNPFVRADKNDPELQYWLSWGQGAPASAWKEVLHVEGQPDEVPR